METKKIGHKIIARLNQGEEIIQSLTSISKQYNIQLGTVQALGATNHVIIGLFNTKEKKYHSKLIEKDLEITSLIGNITRQNNEVYLHLHINLADESQQVFGGHLNECRISATCEMFIDVIDAKVDREYDEKIGLNLMKF